MNAAARECRHDFGRRAILHHDNQDRLWNSDRWHYRKIYRIGRIVERDILPGRSRAVTMFHRLKEILGLANARSLLPPDVLPEVSEQSHQDVPAEISAQSCLLFNWHKGKATDDLGPPGTEYDGLFEAAVARSRKFRLYDGTIERASGSILNQGSIQRVETALRQFINRKLGGDSRLIAFQCFTVCAYLATDLEGKYRADPVLTLGGLYGDKGRMFGIDLEVLEVAISQGAQTSELDLHAWLTFPTGEIVDPVLLTSAAVHQLNIGVKSGHRKLVYGHPRQFQKLRYEPMIIGDAIFSRLGMIKGVLPL